MNWSATFDERCAASARYRCSFLPFFNADGRVARYDVYFFDDGDGGHHVVEVMAGEAR